MFLSTSLFCQKPLTLDTLVWQNQAIKSTYSIPSITNIEHDRNGNLWISTFNGVFKYDGYEVKKYDADENKNIGLVKNKVLNIHKDDNGDIWFAGAYSIYRYSEKYDDLERMTEKFRSKFKTLYDVSYFDIEDLNDEHKILGTKKGGWIYHIPTKSITGSVQIVDSLIIDRYSTNAHIYQMTKDVSDDQTLWMLMKSGIAKFNKSTFKSECTPYPASMNTKRFGDRGQSLIDTKDKLYLLLNFLTIYEFDKQNKSWKTIPVFEINGKKKHIRNLLPFQDGFLIIYIGHDVEYYNTQSGERYFLYDKYHSDTEGHGHSHMTYDQDGRLTFVHNNRGICKSTRSFSSKKNEQHIYSKNLFIEDLPRPDSMSANEVIILSDYQRDIQFEIGLSNRQNTDVEQFFYKINDNEHWIPIANYTINLDGLGYGYHDIKVKAITNEKTIIADLKRFYIKPFFYETWWFLTLVILSILGVGSIIFYLFNIRKKDKQRYEQQLLSLEMNTLRSQMNPHFLFNSLNSIKNYVVSKSRDEAANYLTDFSRLIRMILENSRRKFLTLEDEINMLKLYIDMESRRLNNSFTYIIEIHPEVNQQFIVPPLLLQPYIENAIWHGLMSKYGEKHLSIKVEPNNDGVICRIHDNGIGRKASLRQKEGNRSSKKSLAMKITRDRFKIFNQMYNINTSCEVIDLYDEKRKAIGTEVVISLPRVSDHFHEVAF